ncbi:MAG: cation-translocating P-type ATPase [Desulfobacteraceae bacterium]|nr:MAG: cation-translocating P-type ATPase [Desulfobacteraceae bacterium]
MTDHVYHCVAVDQAASQLETQLEAGLSTQEVEKRQRERGFNELAEKPRPGFLKMLLDQFNNFLVIILIVAAVVSLLLGEYVDAIAIMVIVVLNAVVGVVQESKAEQALAALKKMAAPNAQVIRNGHQVTVPSRELVQGDIVLIEAGNYVPADIRLIESVNLKIEEASLTGESVPVEKAAGVVLDKEIPLGDRKNSAFMSTTVTYGRGKGIVTATGMHTQIGMIAEMLQSYEDEATPLQIKLNQLAKMLGIGCLTVCGIIFIWGLIRDTHIMNIFDIGLLGYFSAEKHDIINLFMTAVSLAIAAVPEGLPAVVTICLALGMQRMIRRHALIRKLPAVETLGCATVICSDKTGTLTQNEMTVVQGWAGGKYIKVSGEGYNPVGQFSLNNQPFDPLQDQSASLLLHGAVLCNDAKLEETAGEMGEKGWRMIGDPTEGAMVVAGAKGGLFRDSLEAMLPRVMEIPFDSERKRMTTIHKTQGGGEKKLGFDLPPVLAFVKGAPDIVLNLCEGIMKDGKVVPVSEEERNGVLKANQDLAKQALRVLGIAYRPMDAVPETCDSDNVEQKLTFVGLLGMIDPPRPEVKAAVKLAQGAGLKSVMVTGDYKDTAEAVARDIGLLSPNGKVFSGAELDKMSTEELVKVIDHVDVCCRVSPKNKTQIVDAFKARDHVVAMTGDGVNDAPALKRANIGVAMGITGTDVTKETADMVLTDDNFASIVSAIEEGRTIYSNIRKFVYFLLVCNVGEILIVFLSVLFGMPVPFRPIQLLWLNLVTDGAPALALGMEKAEPDIMNRPPRPTKEPVINREMAVGLIVVPIVDTIAILSIFAIGLSRYPDSLSHAQTMAFTGLCLSELLRAFTARSEHYSIFSIGFFSNRYMVAAVVFSLLLVLVTVYVPFLQPFFGTEAITLLDWVEMIPFVLMAPVAAELVKIYLRRTERKSVSAVTV